MKIKKSIWVLLLLLPAIAYSQQGEPAIPDSPTEYTGIFEANVSNDGLMIVKVSRIARKVNPFHKSDNGFQRSGWEGFAPKFEIRGLGTSKFVGISKVDETIDLYGLIDPKITKGVIDVICTNCTQSLPPEIASEFDISTSVRLGVSVEEVKANVKKYRASVEERQKNRAKEIAERKYKEQQEEIRKAREGDDSYEDKTCKKFGYKFPSVAYSDCRLKIELAQREAAERKIEFEAQMKVYRAQQAEYEEKNRIYQERVDKDAKRIQAQRSLDMGLRMMGGQSPQDAYLSIGTGAPIAPLAPQESILPRTYVMPGGKVMNCTTTGSVTNCN